MKSGMIAAETIQQHLYGKEDLSKALVILLIVVKMEV